MTLVSPFGCRGGSSILLFISISCLSMINILALSEVTIHPNDNITVAEGSDVTLRCEATGNGTLDYRWRIESRRLLSNTVGRSTSNLTIYNINARNDGKYYCKVSNGMEQLSSKKVQVTTRRIPLIVNSPSDQQLSVISGSENVTLTCEMTGDDITGGYLERVNGGPLPVRNNISILSNDKKTVSMTIRKARPSHSGRYHCIIYSPWGVAQSRNVQLIVRIVPPIITLQPNDQNIIPFQNAAFTCKARGFRVRYEWKRHNGKITVGKQSTLTIFATPFDEDQYYCIAMNTEGYAFSNNVTLVVDDTIVISQHPQSVTLAMGRMVTLRVVASGPGKNKFTYHWRKKNSVLPFEVNGQRTPNFSIRSATTSASGSYYCVIMNEWGNTIRSNDATVNVKRVPKIINDPENQQLSVVSGDENVTLTCEITGDDITGGYWERMNAGPLPVSNNISSLSNDRKTVTMTIRSVRPHHSGMYRCLIYSPWGVAQSRSIAVTVTVAPPIITKQPTDQTIFALQNVTFACEAKGFEVKYEWKRHNGSITYGRQSSLFISRATLLDGDRYYCVAMTEGGYGFSNNVTLTVNIFTPRIVTHPTDVYAAAPFSAVFSCSFNSYDYLTITWYKNNMMVLMPSSQSIFESSVNVRTSTLIVPNVTCAEDVGTYHCEVWASKKGTRSRNANLYCTDQPPPPKVMTDPVIRLTVNNYNLTMKCLSNMSNLNYKWIKKDDVLPSLRARNVHSSQLTIINLQPEDSGDYQCVMSNDTGTISSNFSTVSIKVVPPVISEHPNDMNISLFQSALFKCSAYGFGVVKIVWKRVEYNMPVTAEVTEEKENPNNITSILKITSSVGHYSGQFYCIAKNEAGEVISQAANLHIKVPEPEMIISPKNVTVLPNHNFTMNCLALSFGVFKYDWYKRDGILPQTAVKSYAYNFSFNPVSEEITNIYNLAVHKVQPSDEGLYCCAATNIGGSTEHCAWLEVDTLPTIIKQPVSSAIKRRDLNVIAMSCLAVGIGHIYYQWEKYHPSSNSWISPSRRAVSVTFSTLKFDVITEEDEGVYRCIVSNDDGYIISDNATVHVYSPPIITFISNRTVSLEGEKVALICMAINDADAISLQINWYKGSNLVMPKRHHIHINETAVASTQLNSTLLFNAVSRNDSGGYTCRAFNHNDSFSASKIKLIVQYPPVLSISEASPYITYVGRTPELFCRATGKPNPKVRWYKDDTAITISSRFHQGFRVPTAISHTTVYTCKAGNNAGDIRHTRSANITVIVRTIEPCLPLLDPPENGKITEFETDGIARQISFSCNLNYTLEGNSSATCINGMWNATEPTCNKL